MPYGACATFPVGDAPTEIGPDTRVEEYSVRVSVSHLPWHVIRRPLSSLDHQETTFSHRALPYRCRMSRRLRNRFSNCRPGPYFGRAWRFCCLGGHYWLRGDPRRLCFHRQRSPCSLAFLYVEPRRRKEAAHNPGAFIGSGCHEVGSGGSRRAQWQSTDIVSSAGVSGWVLGQR